MFQTPQGRVVGPQTGNAICIIDDPFATKADGTRSSAAAGAPSYENRFPGLRDASNAVEVEFWDGAELSIEDVEIAPGRELQFEWCFVRGASPLRDLGGGLGVGGVGELAADQVHALDDLWRIAGRAPTTA